MNPHMTKKRRSSHIDIVSLPHSPCIRSADYVTIDFINDWSCLERKSSERYHYDRVRVEPNNAMLVDILEMLDDSSKR